MKETTTVLAVPDIGCDHCRQAIQAELGEATGVGVDVRGRIVRLSHDGETAPVAALSDRLEGLGYRVAGSSDAA